jgi:hypothetical protein
MLEKAISKSASGSADIQAFFPRGIDPESFEGSLELFAAAGYVPRWGENLDVRGGRIEAPGLSTQIPSTRTCPAKIKA